MALYPEELIQEVISANDITDIVSLHVKLKKSSGGYVGLCPFHNEKTPSFHVSQNKQLYHCFGCGEGGSVVNFIMKVENLDFVESIKLLADKVGITLPEKNVEANDQYQNKKKLIFDINKAAAKFFYRNMSETAMGEKAAAYLENRQITKKTMIKFGLGVSGDGSKALYQYLIKENFDLEDMVDAGLIINGEKGVYDRFRNRLIFPIFDLRANIIGFGGRVFDDSMPKYLNSPETAVFSKGQNVFALNFSKSHIRDSIILVEGYMDVIALHQSGIETAVATLGTAITIEQARLMGRYCKEVYICYDSDDAGKNATLRAIEIFAKTKVRCKICDFKGAKDPDEYIRSMGKDAFLAVVLTAKSAVMYKVNLLRQKYNLDDVEEKIDFVKGCGDILATLNNSIELEAYLKQISKYCDISEEALYTQIRKKSSKTNEVSAKRYYNTNIVHNNKGSLETDMEKSQVFVSDKLKDAQKMLLSLISERKELYRLCRQEISSIDFCGEIYIKSAKFIYDEWENNKEPSLAGFMSSLSAEETKEASDIFLKPTIYDDYHKAIRNLILTIKEEKLNMQIKTETNREKLSELVKEQMQLRKEGEA